MQICETNKCFGCALCSDSCPVNAITMTDKSGFYRPQVDANKCISCGLCKKVCISNYQISLSRINDAISCFAVYSRNEDIHFESASGGICTELSNKVIEDGGYVAGAWWNPEEQLVEHRICKTVEEACLLKKSKYVQSKTEGIYKSIAEIIKKRKCLFIGVPCQVYALKKYIPDNNNLYCIDLLCRGGSSSKCLKEHLNNINSDKASYISFRGGEDDCTFVVYNKRGKQIYRGPQFTDPYFNYFMEHVLYQENCYECPFAGKQRIGDLTVGDFWGLAEEAMPQSGGYGINMVFVNTEKGQELYASINDKIVATPRKAAEAISGNETLQCPTSMPPNYFELWERINRVGFKKAIDLFSLDDYKQRVNSSMVAYRKYRIVKTVKRILPKTVVQRIKHLYKIIRG